MVSDRRTSVRSTTCIVVPCYNEALRLDVGKFSAYCTGAAPVHLLFVDDGSTDNTLAVLQTLAAAHPGRVKVSKLERNSGKAEAVRRGLLIAIEDGFDYVGFWDADLATPLQEIETFCRVMDDHPQLLMAIGSRVKLLGRSIRRRPIRHYLGRVFATVVSLILRLPVYDTQCGAKILRVTPETRALLQEPFITRWIFDVEILARLINARGNSDHPSIENLVFEIPLDEWHDVAGSKLRSRDFLHASWQLLTVWRVYMWRN
jgi:dolichyl-phosphate beta-glucosyltransferase